MSEVMGNRGLFTWLSTQNWNILTSVIGRQNWRHCQSKHAVLFIGCPKLFDIILSSFSLEFFQTLDLFVFKLGAYSTYKIIDKRQIKLFFGGIIWGFWRLRNYLQSRRLQMANDWLIYQFHTQWAVRPSKAQTLRPSFIQTAYPHYLLQIFLKNWSQLSIMPPLK